MRIAHFQVIFGVGLFFLSAGAQAAEQHYRLEGRFTLPQSSVVVDLKAEYFLADSPDYQDTFEVSVKANKTQAWTQVARESHVRIGGLLYSSNLAAWAKIQERTPSVQLLDVKKGTAISELNLQYDKLEDGGISKKYHYQMDWLSESIRNSIDLESLLNPAGTESPGVASIPTALAATFVFSNKGIVIREGAESFEITNERNALVIRNSAGKSVVFAQAQYRLPINSDISVADGILRIKGVRRRIDLRMFDAEVKFIGDTQAYRPVKDGDGKTLNGEALEELIDTQFVDLVGKEREQMKRGQQLALEEVESPAFLQMARVLKSGRSVKLLGPGGSGKTTEVKMLARQVAQGKIKSIPRTAEIRVVALGELSAGTKFSGTIEAKVQALVVYARAQSPVYMMDEFHVIEGTGVTQGAPSSISEMLKPGLEDGEIRIIGISTSQQWINAFGSNATFDQRFEEVSLQEPVGEELRKRIRNSFVMKKMPVPTKEAIEEAIKISDRFAVSGAQPRKAVNLLLKANGIMEELHDEDLPADLEAVRKAAVSTYRLDPIYFDHSHVVERLMGLEKALKKKVVGQDHAIDSVERLWFRKLTGVGSSEWADALFFFGPPGVGKTLTANLSAKEMGYKVVLIEMNKYADGDVEAFRYEVYKALRESPTTVIVLDEIEKAKKEVQNSALAMIQPGKFVVNFKDGAERTIFEEVKSSNAVFVFTSNAGQDLLKEKHGAAGAPAIGFKAANQKPVSKAMTLTRNEKVAALVNGGVAEALVSRVSEIEGLSLPTAASFQEKMENEIQNILVAESEKNGVKFELRNPQDLVRDLMKKYSAGESDFRVVNYLLRQYLEPLISQALIMPGMDGATRVIIEWKTALMDMRFPTSLACNFLLHE